jgi:hypothetical protein
VETSSLDNLTMFQAVGGVRCTGDSRWVETFVGTRKRLEGAGVGELGAGRVTRSFVVWGLGGEAILEDRAAQGNKTPVFCSLSGHITVQ